MKLLVNRMVVIVELFIIAFPTHISTSDAVVTVHVPVRRCLSPGLPIVLL